MPAVQWCTVKQAVMCACTCEHSQAACPAFAAVEGQLCRAKLPANNVGQTIPAAHEGYDHHAHRGLPPEDHGCCHHDDDVEEGSPQQLRPVNE